ncbi:MAG TPA: hypothetical protein VM165_08110 [Planctomycetaceae bacterium]|nr:hypothetical protein [Planctomycetaceae bacterium]
MLKGSLFGCYAWLTAITLVGADDLPMAVNASPKLQYLIDRWRDVQFEPTGDGANYQFQATPLMQWQNPISGADGAVFVWTSAGRPVVLCKCHVNDIKQHYVSSSVSLATERFVMKAGGRIIWSPQEPGLTRRAVPDTNVPADRDTGRLVQMRAIARRFRMISVWGEENSSEWELRLLPTPLLRYSSPQHGVIDGALFGFAQGTNPETIVLVEAVQTPKGTEWQAAPARATGYAVRAWLDDDLVLDVPAVRTAIVNSTYHHVYERPSPYPFAKAAE